eukprot:7151471-Ditylum_brightwellii.AAC.1
MLGCGRGHGHGHGRGYGHGHGCGRGQANEHNHSIDRMLGLLESNTRGIALQPAQRVSPQQHEAAENAGGDEEEDCRTSFVATLSRCPCDQHILWHEFEFGIGGRKATKLFSSSECGRVKVVYTKRRVVWDTISNMVHAGYSAQHAIDKIYDVYGWLSVTEITKKLREDKKHSGHIDLR